MITFPFLRNSMNFPEFLLNQKEKICSKQGISLVHCFLKDHVSNGFNNVSNLLFALQGMSI